MIQEYWINNEEDWKEFQELLNGEPLKLEKKDKEGNFIYQTQEMTVYIPEKFQSKKYDSLIFGKGNIENVTNITIDNEIAYIYKSDGSCEERTYYNWALGCNYDDGCQRLKGNQYFKYIKELPEDQFYMLKNNWNPRIWTPRSSPEGFMLKTGETYYKGMKVSDVSLLSFDIEATTLDKDDPNAFVPLVSTTFRDKNGITYKKLFDIFDYENQESMIADVNFYISDRNPDIVLGHNILSYDLPYLDKNSTGIEWGKNGSRILFDDKASRIRKDGSQQYEFFNASIHGREIVDTFFLSIKYDISRDFPSYGLKAIEKHLGLVKEDRTWDFQKWPVSKLVEAKKNGNDEIWAKFRQYCQDDSDSPIKMFDIMIPSFFYLCQSVPKTLQQMINEASGSQLDSLMIRSYLQNGHSLPRSSQKVEFEGAVSMGIPGSYSYVKKVDVASLYPSIMLEYNIYDKKKDPERNMLKMLEYFRTERLTNKKLAKETGDKYYDDLQNAQKILINSLYGFMGAGYLLFNYPEGAAEVTKRGREILLKGVEWATGHTLEKVLKETRNKGLENEEERFHWILGEKVSDGLGYTLVNVDTDSFSYTNNTAPTQDDFNAEIERLNKLYPELIRWENDGVYEKFIVVKAKNYVMVKDGKVKYKGSSLTDQKKEPRLLKLLEELINVLLNDKPNKEAKLIETYNQACCEAAFTFDVKHWVTKKTVSEKVLNANRPNEQKILNACNMAIEHKIIDGVQAGDKVYLYQAIDGMIQAKSKGELVFSKKGEPKMIQNEILKFPELYQNDQDTEHYLGRVYATVTILENIVDINKFTNYSLKKNRELLK
jgi:DNA polymerase elongation subunit (family B)